LVFWQLVTANLVYILLRHLLSIFLSPSFVTLSVHFSCVRHAFEFRTQTSHGEQQQHGLFLVVPGAVQHVTLYCYRLIR
jgi:hypothetical protein